jgi:hypothetical protein
MGSGTDDNRVTTQVVNAAYTTWYTKDQAILEGILATCPRTSRRMS